MSGLLYFGLTVFIACIGGYFAQKHRWPSGAMTGSMLAVMLFNVLFGKAVFPSDLRTVMMILSGFTIGAGISRSDLKAMPALILPIIIVVVGLAGYCIGLGTLITKVSDIEIATALFATVPGGVSDMAAISESLGSNTAQVSILQLWRLMSIYIVIPPLFRFATKKQSKGEVAEQISKPEKAKCVYWRIGLSILCAAIGALIFSYIGMSAGIIIGAMLGSAIFGVATKKVEYPDWLKFTNKILSGMYLGSQITMQEIKTLGQLFLPALMMLVGMTLFVLLCGWLLSKITKLNFASGLIASTPGGLQEMVYLSEDIGANPSQTAVIQTARLFGVYLFYPPMLEFVIGLFR